MIKEIKDFPNYGIDKEGLSVLCHNCNKEVMPYDAD